MGLATHLIIQMVPMGWPYHLLYQSNWISLTAGSTKSGLKSRDYAGLLDNRCLGGSFGTNQGALYHHHILRANQSPSPVPKCATNKTPGRTKIRRYHVAFAERSRNPDIARTSQQLDAVFSQAPAPFARSSSTSVITCSAASGNGATSCSTRICRARSLARIVISLRPCLTHRSYRERSISCGRH